MYKCNLFMGGYIFRYSCLYEGFFFKGLPITGSLNVTHSRFMVAVVEMNATHGFPCVAVNARF